MNKEYKDIKLEDVEKAITDAFYGKTYPQMREERIPYLRQLGEDSWEIFSGESTIRCNNAGKEMFDKAMVEAGKKLTNNEIYKTNQ